MRIMTYVSLLLLVLAAGCMKTSRWTTAFPPSQIISSQTGENQFTILAVEDNDVSMSQVKQAARQKGAEVTLENGFKYFSIVSEKQIQVVKSSSNPSSQMPSNMYQELIIEGQFGRDYLSRQAGGLTTDTYPAIKLVIECYNEKPLFKNSIDAQKYLNQ